MSVQHSSAGKWCCVVRRAVSDVSKGRIAFKTSGTIRPTTQHHTVTDMNLHQPREHLKFRILSTVYVGINLHCKKSSLFNVKMNTEIITFSRMWQNWQCYNLHVCTVHQQYQSTFLLFQTDAHNYKIIGILKQLKFRLSLRHVSVHARTIIRELFRA